MYSEPVKISHGMDIPVTKKVEIEKEVNRIEQERTPILGMNLSVNRSESHGES